MFRSSIYLSFPIKPQPEIYIYLDTCNTVSIILYVCLLLHFKKESPHWNKNVISIIFLGINQFVTLNLQLLFGISFFCCFVDLFVFVNSICEINSKLPNICYCLYCCVHTQQLQVNWKFGLQKPPKMISCQVARRLFDCCWHWNWLNWQSFWCSGT